MYLVQNFKIVFSITVRELAGCKEHRMAIEEPRFMGSV